MRENSWLSYTDEDDKNVEVLAGEYKEFLSKCKTDRTGNPFKSRR